MSRRQQRSLLLWPKPPEGIRFSVTVDVDLADFDCLSAEQTTAVLRGIGQIVPWAALEGKP